MGKAQANSISSRASLERSIALLQYSTLHHRGNDRSPLIILFLCDMSFISGFSQLAEARERAVLVGPALKVKSSLRSSCPCGLFRKPRLSLSDSRA